MSKWKLVSEEPTGDGKPITLKHNMQRQGAARMWEVTDRQVAGLDMAAEIYRAMLDAAPKPPAGLYVVSEDGTARRVEVDEDGLARTLCTSFYEGGTIYEESVETVIEVRWPEWRPQARAVLRALTGDERHD